MSTTVPALGHAGMQAFMDCRNIVQQFLPKQYNNFLERPSRMVGGLGFRHRSKHVSAFSEAVGTSRQS